METLLTDYARRLRQRQYLKQINREWAELMTMDPAVDQGYQIKAMKEIKRKIRMMGEV